MISDIFTCIDEYFNPPVNGNYSGSGNSNNNGSGSNSSGGYSKGGGYFKQSGYGSSKPSSNSYVYAKNDKKALQSFDSDSD